jgi:hypothetical protein
MSLEDFNLYVFRGLRGEFKDLVTSLITKEEPLSYADLHSHILTHEFLHKNSFHSMVAAPFLLYSSSLPQQPPLLPTPQFSAHHDMSHHSPNFSRNKDYSRVIGVPTATATLPKIGVNLLQIGGQTTSSRPDATPAMGSGLDSSMYAANCALVLVTQLPIVPSFAAALNSPTWFPDTGANQHVTPNLGSLTDSAPYLGNDYLHVGDGKGFDISHIGHTTLHSPKCMFTLSNVLHVPHITKPLLSV